MNLLLPELHSAAGISTIVIACRPFVHTADRDYITHTRIIGNGSPLQNILVSPATVLLLYLPEVVCEDLTALLHMLQGIRIRFACLCVISAVYLAYSKAIPRITITIVIQAPAMITLPVKDPQEDPNRQAKLCSCFLNSWNVPIPWQPVSIEVDLLC